MNITISKSNQTLIIKFCLFSLSVLALTWLVSFPFAAFLLTMILFHEYGHLCAARKLGLETGGIYFLPFLGGVAIVKGWHDRTQECHIALGGPIFGLIYGCTCLAIYYITKMELFAIAAGTVAVVNLFNLLPINPLDGGRIFKSLCFSLGRKVGSAAMFLTLLLAGFLAVRMKWPVMVLVIIIGYLDLRIEMKKSDFDLAQIKVTHTSFLFYAVKTLVVIGMFVLLAIVGFSNSSRQTEAAFFNAPQLLENKGDENE